MHGKLVPVIAVPPPSYQYTAQRRLTESILLEIGKDYIVAVLPFSRRADVGPRYHKHRCSAALSFSNAEFSGQVCQ
jgi:hypothetical protein